ncbi:MAG: hypothetical protein U1F43_14385 [Myxococcota bacterium]
MSPAPRPLALFITGTLFTALFLAAPLAHQSLRPTARDLALLLVPTLVLLVCLARPLPALLYGLFPASHLALLAFRPDLAGPMVYRTAWPLLAVIGAGAGYLFAASRRLTPRALPPTSRSELPLVVGGALLALGPLLAFTLPALARDTEPQTAALTAVLGPLAAWYAAGRLLPRLVAPPALSGLAHREAWVALEGRPLPRRRTFIIAAVLAALALALAALWYMWGPPPPPLSGGSIP